MKTNTKHPSGPQLQAFKDGELDSVVAAEVAAHCERCETCRAELAELQVIADMLSELPTPELPRTVWHRVRPGRRRESRLKPAFGIAACALGIALGVLIGPIQFSASETSAELAWSETVSVWNDSASSPLLGIYQSVPE